MCPDPALLVAYLDGTLFSRDKDAIDAHLSSCEPCTVLLVSMRQVRAAEESQRSHRWKMLAGGFVVGVIGIGVWTLRSTPADAPAPAPALTLTPEPTAETREIAQPAPPSPPAATARPAASAKATPKPRPAPVDTRPRTQWRTNERVVERSTDGGMTWTTEYTADRLIRASAFVNDDVAWVVGENGLLVRRTKNGWFGASPPADGHITAVRASSPSRATVTLDDGRVFTTQNGGVTWTAP
jgi:hypothetical protein